MTDNAVTDSNANLQTAPKIAIIGGGLTGLLTATLLERTFAKQAHTFDVPQLMIFEKSRSVGRLATRYRTDAASHKNWQWAFGAQFFTAKSDSFAQFIQPWQQTGLLQPWCANVVDLIPSTTLTQSPIISPKEQWDNTHARYISTPKMTHWGRELAANLRLTNIHFKTHIAPLRSPKSHDIADESSPQKTELFDDKGNHLGLFDWVICTTPSTQAHDLMANSGFSEQQKIAQAHMQACYTLMLGWDDIEQLPPTLCTPNAKWDVAYIQQSLSDNSPLDRIFIEHHKPAQGNLLPSITIHARNDWSEAHVDDDMDIIKAQLLTAAQHALHWSNDTAPSQIDCHRWRYATTLVAPDAPELGILLDAQQQWIISGDWCAQGNIESCYQMALQTVAIITANNNHL